MHRLPIRLLWKVKLFKYVAVVVSFLTFTFKGGPGNRPTAQLLITFLRKKKRVKLMLKLDHKNTAKVNVN